MPRRCQSREHDRRAIGEVMGAWVTRALLTGCSGDWPLAGHVLGCYRDLSGGYQVHWAGRVGAGADLDEAWRASRVLDRFLAAGAREGQDARSCLTAIWCALESITPSRLGPTSGQDLSLLLVATDAQGVTLSAVGLGCVDTLGQAKGSRTRPWIQGEHPLLGPPGMPDQFPGALTLPSGPSWFVGGVWGEPGPSSTLDERETLLVRCGVHP